LEIGDHASIKISSLSIDNSEEKRELSETGDERARTTYLRNTRLENCRYVNMVDSHHL
jgi:hypothetical protein